MIGKLKELIGYRLFLLLSYLIVVLSINLITTLTFFRIMINNGILYGYIVDVTNRASELTALVVGMTLVVSAPAETDTSVGIVMTVAMVVRTRVLASGGASVSEYVNPYVLAVLVALAAAVVRGGFNGLLVIKLKIQPMVATLILLIVGRDISQLVTNGWVTYIRVDRHKLLGDNIPEIPIPTPISMAIIIVAPTYILLKKTTMGVYIQSVGINEEVSQLVGLKSMKVIWMVHAFCGLCAGTAGLMASSRIHSADTNNIGLNTELDTIAAVALGGNSLGGGRFFLLGSVIGAYTIQALATIPYAMSVSTDQIPVYKAIMVILIVVVQSEELKKFKKRLAPRHSSKNVEGGVT